jgi:hypothetical protein
MFVSFYIMFISLLTRRYIEQTPSGCCEKGKILFFSEAGI